MSEPVMDHHDRRLGERMEDPEFRKAFEEASAEIRQLALDVGRACDGCGSFGRHKPGCFLGDDA